MHDPPPTPLLAVPDPTQAASELVEALCLTLPAVVPHLEDPDITEIYLNPDGLLRVMSHRDGRRSTGERVKPYLLRVALQKIAWYERTTLEDSVADLSTELPDLPPFYGARVQAMLPSVTGGYALTLRKRPRHIFTFEDYLQAGILCRTHHEMLVEAIGDRSNILVVGGTGSGKTTLVNACLHDLSARFPDQRLVLLEDTVELQTSAEDHVALRTSPQADLRALVKATLRLTPDRIIVGEVRDGTALHLLDAWQTGHPGGLATVHATTPQGALERLDRLAQQNPGVDSSQAHLIADTVDLIVLIGGHGDARTISSVTTVRGLLPDGSFDLHHTPKETP